MVLDAGLQVEVAVSLLSSERLDHQAVQTHVLMEFRELYTDAIRCKSHAPFIVNAHIVRSAWTCIPGIDWSCERYDFTLRYHFPRATP